MVNELLFCLLFSCLLVRNVSVKRDDYQYPAHHQQDTEKADPPKEFYGKTIAEKPLKLVQVNDAIYPPKRNITNERAFKKDKTYKWKVMNIYIERSHFTEDEVILINQAASILYNILSPCGVHIGIWSPGILPHSDYVKIVNEKGRGCFSMIGRIGGEQKLNLETEMSLPWSCVSKKNILHELLHALGFQHEHIRGDRDEHVEILWENIAGKMLSITTKILSPKELPNKLHIAQLNEIDNQKFNFEKNDDDDTFGFPYNINSIMHYDDTLFAKSPGLITMKSRNGNKTLGWIGDPENPLQGDDVEMIKRAYCNNHSQSSITQVVHAKLFVVSMVIGFLGYNEKFFI